MWKVEIQERGSFIFPPMFLPHELKTLEQGLTDPGIKRSRAGVRHALRIEAVAKIAREPRLLEIAKIVLGPGAVPYHATLFEKSPDANWLVVWHQDTALPLVERTETQGWGPWSVKEGVTYAHAPASALSKVLALRVHLDDSTTVNGPLRIAWHTPRRST